jgi:hypothetical protein
LSRIIGALALATASVDAHAQDLEPRAYANTPVGLNFLIGGYAYTKGTVGTDASVPLEDTEVTLNSAVLLLSVILLYPYVIEWAWGRLVLATMVTCG